MQPNNSPSGQPQLHQVNLMEYYQFFVPHRGTSPGADAICTLIEEKTLELLKQVTLMVVPQAPKA